MSRAALANIPQATEANHIQHFTFPNSHTGDSDGKESACSAGNLGLIPGPGRSPGERNVYPLQYSCQGNLMDRGAWQGCKQLDTT